MHFWNKLSQSTRLIGLNEEINYGFENYINNYPFIKMLLIRRYTCIATDGLPKIGNHPVKKFVSVSDILFRHKCSLVSHIWIMISIGILSFWMVKESLRLRWEMMFGLDHLSKLWREFI